MSHILWQNFLYRRGPFMHPWTQLHKINWIKWNLFYNSISYLLVLKKMNLTRHFQLKTDDSQIFRQWPQNLWGVLHHSLAPVRIRARVQSFLGLGKVAASAVLCGDHYIDATLSDKPIVSTYLRVPSFFYFFLFSFSPFEVTNPCPCD